MSVDSYLLSWIHERGLKLVLRAYLLYPGRLNCPASPELRMASSRKKQEQKQNKNKPNS